MTTPTTHQEQTELSLGEQFRRAREALNLSLEDVSERINLRPSILQHLENNEFTHKSIPSTFMKGYVRNYAKFLRLPESAWAGVIASVNETTHNDLGKNARATKAVNQYSSHNRWVGSITALVLLIVAGMTALWWWENYQQSNAERDSLVQSYVENTENNVSPAVVETIETPAVANDNAQTSEVAPLTAENAVNSPMPETENNAVQEENTPLTSAQTLQTEMDKINGTNTAEVAPDQQASETAATSAVSGDLQIEITGTNCWISVKDANRKVLAQKEYKQGETLSFNQGAPYSLIIGAPGNVKITYKGEVYPLKVDGRVAKFKLQ
ncbi:RodZ domain-containing protein [Caviibacterium pharyngocola]|uniref:DUF4115 domain-containing protein n=1 Tax=Caviibacterium pharyngocola TaxID=28159 RepID=A0A2M8RZ21_9PAST|nr:RodZ family helix-turn-helix domain-containing protein [Caviibacterium pharyngocola]PJG84143.1 DUF4115 domain-containing protein [Caviibacterium pharyngocola]